MLSRPEGLDERALLAELEEGWAIRTASASYLPLGAGSHHWWVEDIDARAWFVTVDDRPTSTFMLSPSVVGVLQQFFENRKPVLVSIPQIVGYQIYVGQRIVLKSSHVIFRTRVTAF